MQVLHVLLQPLVVATIILSFVACFILLVIAPLTLQFVSCSDFVATRDRRPRYYWIRLPERVDFKLAFIVGFVGQADVYLRVKLNVSLQPIGYIVLTY